MINLRKEKGNCRICRYSSPNDGKMTKEKNVSLCSFSVEWNGITIDKSVVYNSHHFCCEHFKHY